MNLTYGVLCVKKSGLLIKGTGQGADGPHWVGTDADAHHLPRGEIAMP